MIITGIFFTALRLLSQIWITLLTFRFIQKRKLALAVKPDLPSPSPGISIVIPVKGPAESLAECLHAIFRQDYPGPLEVILSIEDTKDPAVAEAKRIFDAARPSLERPIEFVLEVGHSRLGPNPKNSNVARGVRKARHDWIYSNDVDTRMPENHLSHCMATVKGDANHYITALSVHVGPKDLFASMEAIGSNVDFTLYYVSSLGNKNPHLLNGAAFLAHKKLLDQVGGYEISVNQLTEDLLFSNRFEEARAQSHQAMTLVQTGGPHQSLRGYRLRQTRWMLIAKCFKPHLYYAAIASQFMHIVLILAILSRSGLLLALVGVMTLASVLQSYLFQRWLGTPREDWIKSWAVIPYAWLVPFWWTLALFTHHVIWGGNKIRVLPNGTLVTAKA